MIDELKKNLENEKKIVEDMGAVYSQLKNSPETDKNFYYSSFKAMENQLKILNDSIPALLSTLSAAKQLQPEQEKETPKDIVKFSYTSPITNENRLIIINRKDKDSFIKELRISEAGLSGLKKAGEQQRVLIEKPSKIAKISNIIFSRYSEKFSPSFSELGSDLKRANIRFMPSTYISIALFVSSIVLLASFLLFFAFIIIYPSLLFYVWAPLLVYFLCLVGFYFYPSIERGNVEKQISEELPFATIHMAAIAGANIEPVKVLKIIASSPEYPCISREMRKVINQIDIYGYDLVTALKNSAKQTSNKKLAELFSGLAINIISGGDLNNYLEKKSENFLLDYRLDRQQYSALAETFMDVYISILITAPLILMMMFIIMNMTGLSVGGLSLNDILIFAIGGVALVNILFLVFLEFKQPKT